MNVENIIAVRQALYILAGSDDCEHISSYILLLAASLDEAVKE